MSDSQYVEKNLNFDELVPRQNTDSLKYDFATRRGKPSNVLPLWVADMDFKTSSIVLDILKARVEHGIFGYTETKEDYFNAVASWMLKRHEWQVNEHWLIKTPGVVMALAAGVKAFTKPGDAVLIQQPVYYPFSEVVLDNDRKLVSNDLVVDDEGHWSIDFADFERKIVAEQVHLFILCSPHNPVGRVWTKEELSQIADICQRHDVIIMSDEIHHDFVYSLRSKNRRPYNYLYLSW